MRSTDPVLRRGARGGALLFAALLLSAGMAQSQGRPLSASDWLSGGAMPPPPVSAWRPGDPIPRDVSPRAPRKPDTLPQGVATDVRVPPVGVTRIDGPDADRAGTLSAREAGLPPDLWAGTAAEAAAAAIAEARPRLPATQHLLRALLLAQLDPPAASSAAPADALFLARVDRLIAMGALEQATQLLDAAGLGDAQRFSRRFDALLLIGDETRACRVLAERPGAAPDLAARLFCLARSGDWDAAATGLDAARATGLIEPDLAARLAAFLDDAAIDEPAEAAPPQEVTPLDFRLLAAIGQPLPTADLPPAFAWTDLGPDNGWKARLDAAERLARSGALPPDRLRAVYLEEPPAASGGVWDRVAAIQPLEEALRQGDREAVTAMLPGVVTAMGQAGLTAAFAAAYVPDLLALQLDGEAGQHVLRLALYASDQLTPDQLAQLPPAADASGHWLTAVARGTPLPVEGAPGVPVGPALAQALTDPPPSLPEGESRGLVLLNALADADAGLDGDAARAGRGVATLRALGLDTAARAAALQLLVGPELGALRQ